MAESVFYTMAYNALNKEYKRLSDLTDALDRNPAEKKGRIAEYKCAKYRAASVSRAYMMLYHGNRVYQLSAIDLDIENSLKAKPAYYQICQEASADTLIDHKLYYGILSYVEDCLEKANNAILSCSDWEKIELTERIGGLTFAKECLDEAWQKQKEVTA